MANPKFNMARGAAVMTGAPPFEFQDVILRVFPLRADIHALRLFCDRFLNIAPDHVLFEPSAPYVIVETINYGRMSPEASNFGWVSQNEVAFAVLLNWYRVENGKPVFQDTASVCPFIFVDEETSIRGGREVFGWPKSRAWLTPGIDAWARDPRSPRTLFTLSAMVFPELFAGQRQEARVLFEIEQEPELSAAEFPVNPFNELNPMVSLPRAVLSSMKMAGDVVQNLVRLPIQGFPLPGVQMPGTGSQGKPTGVAGAGFQTAPPGEMLRNSLGGMNLFAQLPAFNTINLKQFRDSSKPEEVCYQALVNAKMTMKSVKRGGLLGQQAMALGDPSGGFSLKIHRSPAWPIIESLGLEVASEATVRGRQVATLKPVMPNWMDTDFHYGTGEVLCWRSLQTDWAPAPGERLNKALGMPEDEPLDRAEFFRRFGCPPREDGPYSPPIPGRGCASPAGRPHRFNTAQGGSLDQVRGPFHFPDVTMRVLPLLADESRLQEFCDEYLNHGKTELEQTDGKKGPAWRLQAPKDRPQTSLPGNLFKAWGDYVYLIVTNYEEMTSELNVGWWARRQVAFAFPVKWYRWASDPEGGPDYWQLVSFALVSPFIFADSSVAATTGREMQGKPVTRADIESPSGAWLERGGPITPDELLKLSADVYPALNVGQKIERRELLEITGRDVLPSWDEESWQKLASGAMQWGETLAGELEKKQRQVDDKEGKSGLAQFKGLGLEILTGRRPVNHISLKQFRDAADPHTACYQAITLSPETLERVYDLREIDERLHLAIHRYPSQPIIEKLGLKVKWTDETGETVVDYLQPIRPFWLRASVKADLGQDIFWRAGSPTWVPSDLGWIRIPTGPAMPGLSSLLADKTRLREFCDKHEEVAEPLFFERVEPTQFGAWEAGWVEEDPENKRRLQDLGSELTSRQLGMKRSAEREERRKELEDERRVSKLMPLPPGLTREEQRRMRKEELEKIDNELAALKARETPKEIGIKAAADALENLERRRMTPQLALESILSNEWLHFGRPRWERKRDAEGSEFNREIRDLATRKEVEELTLGGRGTPPLKKDFVVRRDTIGHPGIRAKFENDHTLVRLDDEYWYWLADKGKYQAQFAPWGMLNRVWTKLGQRWKKQLDWLQSEVDGFLENAERLRPFLDEIEARRQSLADLRTSVDHQRKRAQESREFESVYQIIVQELRDERTKMDELGERCGEHLLQLLPKPPNPAGSRAPVRKVDSTKAGKAGEKKERSGSTASIPLEPGIIKGLGAASLEVLADHGVATMQDLIEPKAKNFHNWLQNVNAGSAVRMINEAKKIVAQARAKKKT